jgi:chromate reductase
MRVATTNLHDESLSAATQKVRILVIGGSLRGGSHTRALARAAVDLAPADAAVDLYDELGSLPPYDADADADEAPEPVRSLRRRIAAADGVLFVTPEYNGSIPGVLKNAIDWASRPHRAAALSGKTVATAGASPSSYGARWALDDLRRVLGIAGAHVVDEDLSVPNVHEALADGALTDADVRQRLRRHVETFVAEIRPVAAAA